MPAGSQHRFEVVAAAGQDAGQHEDCCAADQQTGQDNLQTDRHSDSAMVNPGNHQSQADAQQQVRKIDGPALDLIQRPGIQFWQQVGQYHSHGDRFESRDGKVPDQQEPADQERYAGTMRLVSVGNFASSDGQHRCQLGITEADQHHQQATSAKGQHRSDGSGIVKPFIQRGDPADADHGPKCQAKETEATDRFLQLRSHLAAIVLFW